MKKHSAQTKKFNWVNVNINDLLIYIYIIYLKESTEIFYFLVETPTFVMYHSRTNSQSKLLYLKCGNFWLITVWWKELLKSKESRFLFFECRSFGKFVEKYLNLFEEINLMNVVWIFTFEFTKSNKFFKFLAHFLSYEGEDAIYGTI